MFPRLYKGIPFEFDTLDMHTPIVSYAKLSHIIQQRVQCFGCWKKSSMQAMRGIISNSISM